ncbi:phage tail protein [Photorhabdus tasmaniensis]|uniref:Phage tail protein n=1 Tax=Photorhabdus tasmaniensis TaxID=1004159 RepID=A0ABX0GFD4_9GAMM|nr:phage tail protein [Photorhabdus tasmaniensis]NHB87812.1 phage tail protein [Photorhabdus tasmaniensis]
MSLKPQNDFKAFSISNNANVVSQERYEESRNLKTGFPPDNVTTHELNKVLRQSSTISSVVANFIATHSGGDDVLDDGDIAKLTAQLNRALEKKITTEIPSTSLTQKGIVQLTDQTGNSDTLAVTQKLASDINDNANNKLAKDRNGADIPDKNEFVKNLGLVETVTKAKNAVSTNDFNSLKTVVDGKANGVDLTRKMDVGAFGLGGAPIELAPAQALASLAGTNGFYARGSVPLPPDNPESRAMKYMNIGSKAWSTQLAFSAYENIIYIRSAKTDGVSWNNWEYVWTGSTAIPDANGFLKKSSPIVEIYPDGTFTTNDESEGAEVTKEATGTYRISNISGYNVDKGWGVQGGISAPKDNNGLELIFVDDRVQCDGSIIIETFHRQHSHLPERFQNWRLKSIDDNGGRVFYKDGEPCDIPEHCRLDVRVQMPADSI